MSSICGATLVRIGSEVFKFVDTSFNSLDSLKLAHGVTKQEIMSLSPAFSPIHQHLAEAYELSRQLLSYVGNEPRGFCHTSKYLQHSPALYVGLTSKFSEHRGRHVTSRKLLYAKNNLQYGSFDHHICSC